MTQEQKTLKVVDSSATEEYPLRTHSVKLHGKEMEITFKWGEDTILPYDLAMKFNQEGFDLYDPATGEKFRAPTKTDETIRIRIQPDEIVARYDELTVDALKVRAVSKQGGEKFLVKEASKEELIEFLKGETVPVVDHEDDLIEDKEEVDVPAPAPADDYTSAHGLQETPVAPQGSAGIEPEAPAETNHDGETAPEGAESGEGEQSEPQEESPVEEGDDDQTLSDLPPLPGQGQFQSELNETSEETEGELSEEETPAA